MQNISVKTSKVKSTMIIGGGTSAQYLADKLIHSGVSVKIIERDRARCEELSLFHHRHEKQAFLQMPLFPTRSPRFSIGYKMLITHFPPPHVLVPPELPHPA